jgi:hypothetical protein
MDIDLNIVTAEIIEVREGRDLWTLVDSGLRVWDAKVIGNEIYAVSADIGRGVLRIQLQHGEDDQ